MHPKNLIILSTSYWHSDLKFRRHHFAQLAAADGYSVVYVNPIFTILSFVVDKDARKCFFDCFKGPQHVAANLFVYTMPPLLPLQRRFLFFDIVNKKISSLFIRWIKKTHFGTGSYVQIVYLPEDVYRLNGLHDCLLVYDCIDEHAEYPWNRKRKKKIEALERELISRAGLVTTTSTQILKRFIGLADKAAYIPNGVEFEFFNKAAIGGKPLLRDMAMLSTPIVVYVGAIAEWFDDELVVSIAEHNRDWDIVLIGPEHVKFQRLKSLPNVKFLGAKPQSLLPAYLSLADVGIIPFKINELTKSVNPLKLYEYLAAGKPVVSTPLPDVESMQRDCVVHIGYTHEDFIRNLEYCIAKSKENVQDRLKLAAEFSWGNLYRNLFDRIEGSRNSAAH